MRLNVLLDKLVGHIARTRSKVAACPQMSPPELAAQFSELFHHLAAAATLDSLHQVADRYLRWYRHQQVHMVKRNMPAQDVYIQRSARLPYQFSQPSSYLASQYRLAIFRDPYQMVLQIVDCVARFTIAHHRIVRLPLLSSTHPQAGVKTACLKGRGFYPIYRQ